MGSALSRSFGRYWSRSVSAWQTIELTPQHLSSVEAGAVPVLLPRGEVLRSGGVVRDGHTQDLEGEGDALAPGALAHRCPEITARAEAANADAGGVEAQLGPVVNNVLER